MWLKALLSQLSNVSWSIPIFPKYLFSSLSCLLNGLISVSLQSLFIERWHISFLARFNVLHFWRPGPGLARRLWILIYITRSSLSRSIASFSGKRKRFCETVRNVSSLIIFSYGFSWITGNRSLNSRYISSPDSGTPFLWWSESFKWSVQTSKK